MKFTILRQVLVGAAVAASLTAVAQPMGPGPACDYLKPDAKK